MLVRVREKPNFSSIKTNAQITDSPSILYLRTRGMASSHEEAKMTTQALHSGCYSMSKHGAFAAAMVPNKGGLDTKSPSCVVSLKDWPLGHFEVP
jgi:hypothetical protein